MRRQLWLPNPGSAYLLSERHGNVFKFSSAGLLTNIVDQYNQPLAVKLQFQQLGFAGEGLEESDIHLQLFGTPQRLTSISGSTSVVPNAKFSFEAPFTM